MESKSTIPPFDSNRAANAVLPTTKIALGEELPIFCEKCGYTLHGISQHVCELCTVRQFHCPECGHHQPINTLRPAFQQILGRIRAFTLAFLVFIKINFFAWITVAWIGMGHTWSYEYDYSRAQMSFNSPSVVAGQPPAKKTRAFRSEAYFPREIDMEVMFAFGLSALAYGAFGRMFLLRWRKGWRVGLVMSGVVIAAIVLGAFWRKIDMEIEPSPLSGSFIILLTSTATALTLGTSIVWGIWVAMVHLFLPKRFGKPLLEWQSNLSIPTVAGLARPL